MNMVENEYEIETKHYAIICSRQREKDKVEAMRCDTMMCKQTTYSQYFSSLLLLRNRITFSILSKLQLSHTLRSQLKPEQLSTSKLSPPIPLFRNVSVSGLLHFFLFVDLS